MPFFFTIDTTDLCTYEAILIMTEKSTKYLLTLFLLVAFFPSNYISSYNNEEASSHNMPHSFYSFSQLSSMINVL